MQRTIGLDFGTHQTKICVEEKDRLETRYSFVTFKDNKGRESYVLPSIIRINSNGKLSYGYIEEGVPGTIVRYFKQATFTENTSIWNNRVNAEYYTIWYLAYIIFLLEEKYGTDFSLNFGIPTDNDRYAFLKRKAISLILSAYRLVEEVYQNEIERFLDENITSLMANTELLAYSDEKKEEFGLLVFPEAYACLRPLAAKGRITSGMNLMVDIGGGTTDISFFTMEKEKETDKTAKPQIYELLSAPIGLNFLTKAEEQLDSGKVDSNVDTNAKLDWIRKAEYIDKISDICYRLRQRILKLYDNSTKLNRDRITQALKDRLIIYTGGGSTFSSLRRSYDGFTDIKHITTHEWGTQSFDEMEEISKLCPILSTVFGLSISATTDKFKTKPLNELFKHLVDAEEGAYDDVVTDPRAKSYKYNWLYKDYGELGAGWNYTPSKTRSQNTNSKPAPKQTQKAQYTPAAMLRLSQTIKSNEAQSDNVTNVQIVNPAYNEIAISEIQTGEIPFNNIPFSEIKRDGISKQVMIFKLGDGSRRTCKCYGKVIIDNGYPYDIYYDSNKNLIIDALHFIGLECERRSFIAVNSSSQLYKAFESYGADKINMIQGNGKKLKKMAKRIIRIAFKVSDSKKKKKSNITFVLTKKNI